MKQTISMVVTGRVQGVFYRQSTKEKADELGINGTVKNTSNGSVHIIATGTNEQLEKLKSWCRQGPPKASVSSIDAKELPLQAFEGFRILRE